MHKFDPKDPGDTPHKLRRIIQDSGLTLQQICDRLKLDYGIELSPSSLSRSMSNGTLQFQRVLQILAVCGVKEVEIKR
jgi:hypothetical protein